MKKVGEFWVPDEDMRFHWFRLWKAAKQRRKTVKRFAAGNAYKSDDIALALARVPGHRVAIDGGAHVGAYTRAMAEHFEQIYAFEPTPDTYAALVKNVQEWGLADRVDVRQQALSDCHERVRLTLSPGQRSISRRIVGPGNIPTVLIDDLDLDVLDFVKLDVEGYELRALRGAEATLKRCRPVVMFEDKEKYGADNIRAAHAYMRSLGAELIARLGRRQNDCLYGF
jgi:FkbM family methyltransferase